MRNRKRALIRDDDEEDTFINNSDFERDDEEERVSPIINSTVLEEDEEEGEEEETEKNEEEEEDEEDDYNEEDEEEEEEPGKEEKEVEAEDASTYISSNELITAQGSTPVKKDASLAESPTPNRTVSKHLETGVSRGVKRSRAPTCHLLSPTTGKQSGTPTLGENTLLAQPQLENSLNGGLGNIPPLSQALSSEIPPEKLSFLHQQSEVQLQSPIKRRELQLQQQQNTKTDEPRLTINKLILTNFKSYAGQQVIGPFNASFSAVVGPNGSGKSNVIDSMLFVFGFRALKMRQGKLSELIHNSEGGQKKIDFCQVDIHFQNVLDTENEDGSVTSTIVPSLELVISRKAYRNNSSQYYINGKSSSYTEVTDFLKGKGIDLDHKRFLILQGEVESIAQMKAKAERENDDGLLEYLEDIIGTTKYKLLIETNLANIDELNDICLEKETRFELVEKDKDSLEEKKNEALKFLEMEKKLIAKKSIQFQAEALECQGVLSQNEAKLATLQEKRDKEKEANKKLNEEIEKFQDEQSAIKKVIANLKEQEQSQIKKQKAINKITVSVEEKLKNLSSKSKRASKAIQSLESVISSSKFKLDQQNAESIKYKQDLNDLVGNLEEEKAKLEEIRSALTVKTSGFSKQIEAVQKKLDPWNDKVKGKDAEIALLTSSVQMLQSQRDNLEKQLQVAREKLVNIKKEGQQKEAELIDLTDKLAIANNNISNQEERTNVQRKELTKMKENLANLRQRTQEASNSLNQNQNRNKVLSSLLRLAKSGRIDGFYGRLGDLGIIDDKYDVAISTAGSGSLDSMVVETVETAQACIAYLRKNNLGSANFVCLTKLRNFDTRPVQTPGNPSTVKRLFDLIQPVSDKFKPAFYSKLYNTLVATNLQEARQASYGLGKRWKVVSLDGKVVDTSGAMSGGGNYVYRGGMKLALKSSANDNIMVTQEEVNELKSELSTAESKFEYLTREFQENERILRVLQNDTKPDLEFALSRIKLDIESLLAQRKEAQKACKDLIEENEKDESKQQLLQEIKEKELQMSQLKSERSELKKEMAEFENQVKELEEMILDAGGVELRLQNSKVDSTKQKIEILNEKISNEKVTVRKLENEIKRHKKILDEAQSELHAADQELEENKVLQESKEAELLEIRTFIQELEIEIDTKQQDLDGLTSQMEEKLQQINEFKSVEIEIEEKIEKVLAVIKKAKRKMEECEVNLSGLIVRDVAPYIEWIEEEEERNKYNGEVLEELTNEDCANLDIESVNQEIDEMERYMENVKVDIEVLKEYGEKKSEFESRRSDLNSAVEKRDNIKVYCEELKRKRLDEFMEGFNTISMSLKEMYQMITMGGNAELELVDSLDPFSEGILFSVMPPKKSWKNISNLSGGEKTLSSLALVFALHRYKPTPLYVMDEIDAALDFRNVSIVANYIKERTKNAQFVVISLRNNMFELAQQLVGIYKVNNMTRSISLQNKDFLTSVK